MSVKDGKLVIETAMGGSILDCNGGQPVTARVRPSNFVSLASLSKDAKASGPLLIVFRPDLGEVGLPYIGTKAKFD